MPVSPVLLSADLSASDSLLATVLEVSLTGIIFFRPVYAPGGGNDIIDLAYEQLNPAAQRMLQQPERPEASFLTLYPHAVETGIFPFYRDTFLSGQPAYYEQFYGRDGLDNFFQLSARRSGELLVVSFTDTADQDRSRVEDALRESQAREQAARADADLQRQQLYSVFEQAPAMICIFDGPQHRFQFVNPPYQALVGDRPLIGKPIAEAMPELTGQPIFGLLDQVYQTGETFYAADMLVQLDHDNAGVQELEKRYYNFIYQARRSVKGDIDGILVFAYEVTPQVQIRQQIQALNEELAVTNEELQASNEEFLTNNTVLLQVRQQLEEAHTATERERSLLQFILEQAPVAIGLFQGPELVVTQANELLCAMWGCVPEAVLGKPILEGVPELEGQGFTELMLEVARTRVPFVGTEVPAALLENGQLKTNYYNFVYQPLLDAAGTVLGVIDIAINVTQQVQARQQVQSLNEELAAANEELQASNEEFLISNAELQRTQLQLEQLNQELEARVQERTKEVEEALHEARDQREQLRTQKALLQQILGQTPASIATLIGPDHRHSFFNAQYQLLAGGRAEFGQTVAEVYPEIVEQGFIGLLDAVYATGKPFIGTEAPTRLYDPATGQNELRYVDFIYQPLLNEEGQPQGILAFILDSTEKVHARQQVQSLNEELAAINEELQATNEELQSANEELGDTNYQLTRTNIDLDTFIYTASHDLKAPITNIEGLLHTLLDELPPLSRQGDVSYILELMHGSVDRFKKTIEHLTDISKLQQEHGQPATLVRLADVVEDVRLDLAPLLRDTGALLEVEVLSCPAVSFSEKNMRSVIYNLLSNALKYHHPGRVPRVRIRCRTEADYLVLSVQDNGLGLNTAQQQRLFGMFQRFHTHVDGSGVGLYMVKKMIENAGGYISVVSQEDVGSTFFVRFPR